MALQSLSLKIWCVYDNANNTNNNTLLYTYNITLLLREDGE